MISFSKQSIFALLTYFLLMVSIPAAQQPIETIGFGSCLKQTRPQPIWESVLEKRPDVFILLGDNIYGDTQDMKKLKGKWNDFSSISGFNKLRQNCRLLGVWDDHDYGENDAGIEFPKKAESQKIFLDFLHEPKDSERRKTPGTYDSVIIGPPGKRIQFILLDTRYFRTPLKRPDKRENGKGPYVPNESKEAKILEIFSGHGWRRSLVNRQRLELLPVAYNWFQHRMVGKPGETFQMNENVSLTYSKKKRQKERSF